MGPANNTNNNQANQTPQINNQINQVIHVTYLCASKKCHYFTYCGARPGRSLPADNRWLGLMHSGRISTKQLCGATRPITVVAVLVQHHCLQALYQSVELRGSLFTLFQPLSTVRRFWLWLGEWDCRYRWLHYSLWLGSDLEIGWQSSKSGGSSK